MRWLRDNVHLVCLLLIGSFLIKDAVSNRNGNLEKESQLIIIGEPDTKSSIPRIQVSEEFIDKKLWPKLLKITHSEPGLKRPPIVFLRKDPYPPFMVNGATVSAMGRYLVHPQRIEIYKFNAYQEIRDFYLITRSTFSYHEWNVLLYHIIAHELLHHVYWVKGIPLENDRHHLKMYREGSIEEISNYLTRELSSNGAAKYLEMLSVEIAVKPALRTKSSR